MKINFCIKIFDKVYQQAILEKLYEKVLEPTRSEQKIPETYEQKVLKKYIKNFRK
jgi:hypothetical protein